MNPRWIALWALLASALIPTTAIDAMGLTLPAIRAYFSVDSHVDMLTGLVGSAAAFSFAVSAPLMGRVIDRVGYRSVYVASLMLFGIVGAAGGLLADLKVLVVSRAVIGVSVAGALTAGLTGISYLDPVRRGKALGFHALVGSAGAMVLFVVVAQLVGYGWRIAFMVHLLGFLLIPLALALPKHGGARPEERAERALSRAGPLFAGVDAKLMATTALAGIVMFSVPMLAPFYLIGIGVTQPALFALPLSIMAFAAMVSAVCYGYVVARMGIAGTFAIGFVLMAAGLGLAGTAGSIAVFTLGLTLIGGSLCMLCPNISAAAMAGAGARPGQAVGVTSAILHGVPIVFPLIVRGGTLGEQPELVFLGFGALAAFGAAFYMLLCIRRGGLEVRH